MEHNRQAVILSHGPSAATGGHVMGSGFHPVHKSAPLKQIFAIKSLFRIITKNVVLNCTERSKSKSSASLTIIAPAAMCATRVCCPAAAAVAAGQ